MLRALAIASRSAVSRRPAVIGARPAVARALLRSGAIMLAMTVRMD
jgi:hypothetical protein